MRKLVLALALLPLAAQPQSQSQPGQHGDKNGGLWPWSSQSAPNPPPVPPFELPTFGGGKRDFREPPAGWEKPPKIDGNAIFRAVVACYPTKSHWQIDVDLQAAVRNTAAVDVSGTTLGRSMVGLVAKMPLYSASEVDREREREYRRRQETAQTVADFVGQLAARNLALRRLALAATMERRSQIRVAQGIADGEEQVKWLDKVADAEKDLIAAETKAAAARLKLVAQCRDEGADAVNGYLTELAQVPRAAVP